MPPIHRGFSLSGRVAFITGAARGIGRALAIGLAKAGSDVVVTDLAQCRAGAEETAHEVTSQGRRALVLSVDVTSNESIELGCAGAVEKFGRIDILVNNAGIAIRRPAFELSPEDWERVISVNLRGVFFCSQSIGRVMSQQINGGKIVNVSSIMGNLGVRNGACYCSSKAGVVSITQVLAKEWAEYKINVNAIAPTFILTPSTGKLFQNEAFQQDVLRHQAIKRFGEPEDVIGAAVFLCSDAASFITGLTLAVDGGWT